MRALYPEAWRGFSGEAVPESALRLIDSRFDTPDFERLFGIPYSRRLVRPASSVIESGVPTALLTEVWSEGRHPVGRVSLERRIGVEAAWRVMGTKEELDWFHMTDWPLGIQRIAPGLVVFATRDERISPAPTLIVNGHFPGLAELFESTKASPSTLIEVGVPSAGVSHLRTWLTGASNDPRRCAAGSIRGDAAAGVLASVADKPFNPRQNIVHCSDGIIAATAEIRGLLGKDAQTSFTRLLRDCDYSESEISYLLRPGTALTLAGTTSTLVQRTAGMSLADVLAFLRQYFPPQFGIGNGHADGFSPGNYHAKLAEFVRMGPREALGVTPSRQEPLTCISSAAKLRTGHERTGQELFAAGRVGVLVPAGGTGGRLGGYALQENDARRQKPLLPLFSLAGAKRSALEIRLANVRYWTTESGGRVPVAVMSAETGLASLDQGLDAISHGIERPEVFLQYGVPRLRPDALDGGDPFLRQADGTFIRKPPGNLGLLTNFALTGLLERWESAGVEFVVTANGDDVGYRLDPGLLGWLDRNSRVDATISVVSSSQLKGSAGEGGHLVSSVQSRSGVALVERGNLSDELSAWVNTNQMVIRVSALREALLGRNADRLTSLRAARSALPLFVENKIVSLPDGSQVAALQMMQAFVDIVRLLEVVQPVQISRQPDHGGVGGFAPVKTIDDVRAADEMLSVMADAGDCLQFA